MTRCNETKPVNFKVILGSFLPLIIAAVIQYAVNIVDVIVLFLRNMASDEKTNSDYTISKILQLDYNQPMNQAYLTLAQQLCFLLCFGIWFYRAFYIQKKSAGERFSPKQIFFAQDSNGNYPALRSAICAVLLLAAGVTIQITVDGALALVRPLFSEAFAAYDELVSQVAGANAAFPALIASFAVAPFAEELLFRGVILGYAKSYMPPVLAILFQGVLFGFYHGNLIQGIYAGILGCLLGFVAYRLGLVRSMLLHFSINISLLFVPDTWFSGALRCGLLTGGGVVVTAGLLWFAVRKR